MCFKNAILKNVKEMHFKNVKNVKKCKKHVNKMRFENAPRKNVKNMCFENALEKKCEKKVKKCEKTCENYYIFNSNYYNPSVAQLALISIVVNQPSCRLVAPPCNQLLLLNSQFFIVKSSC